MAFLSTVLDGVRQTSDVTLPEGRFVVIPVPLSIFENAGSTQVHFGKLDTKNIKRSHYAKIIQYVFDVEVIRRITQACHKAVEKVYLQRRGDYIVLFVIFTNNSPKQIYEVASEMMNTNFNKLNESNDTKRTAPPPPPPSAVQTPPQSKRPRKGDKDQINVPLFISARETALDHPNGDGGVNTACFPATVFNKTPDKIHNYAWLVTSATDIANSYLMMYVDAGFEIVSGAGGGAGGGGGDGGGGGGGGDGGAGGDGGEGHEARSPPRSDDDDAAAVFGGVFAGMGRGGEDFVDDGDDSAADDGGTLFQANEELVKFRVPAFQANDEEDDGTGPAYVDLNVNLTWLELHSIHNPAFKALGIVDNELLTTKTLRNGAGVGQLYRVDATYHMFNSFYQSVEPCGDLLKQFEIFARVIVDYETRADEQNPPGDLAILNMFRHSEYGRAFLDKDPSVAKMREFASAVFSRISTSDGMPESVTYMMRDVNDVYRQSAGVLYSASALSATEAVGPTVLKYFNLSPVANVLMFLMEISELQDATSLHLMDLVITISMLSTGFRPGVTKKDGTVVPDDMALNVLLGGSPGIGKSQVQSRVQARLPLICGSSNITHTSKLANTGMQSTNDQSNHAPEFQDEAKGHMLGADEHKMSNDEKDRVNINKEKMARGELTTKRLQASEERGGGMRMVMTTSKVNHVPHVLNTNNFISCTKPNPSLNRLCSFYPFTMPRLYENTSKTLANKSTSEAMLRKRIDAMSFVYMVFFMLSKLQELGIIPWPDTSVLHAFMHDFELVAKANPFLTCRMFNTSTREYGFVRVAYIHLINFSLVTAFFADPKGKFCGKRFDITQVLELAPYMYVGDLQAAIFALTFKAHELVNPVISEVRARIVSKAACADGTPRFSVGGGMRDQLEVIADDSYTQIRKTAYDKLTEDADLLALMMDKYVFIFAFAFETKSFNITSRDYSSAMKSCFGCADTHRKIEDKDVEEVLNELQIMAPACGPDQGLKYLVIQATENKKGLFALKSWVMEEFKQEWTFTAMLKKALLANKYTPDGRYLVPEALRVGRWDTQAPLPQNPGVAHLFADNAQTRNKYVPNALAFIDIPKHESGCPLGGSAAAPFKASTGLWRRTLAGIESEASQPTCTCFRTKGSVTVCGNERFEASGETMAQMLNLDIRDKARDVLVQLYDVKPPRAWGALGGAVYPDTLLEEIMSASAGNVRTFKPSDAVAERVHDDAVEMDAEITQAQLRGE